MCLVNTVTCVFREMCYVTAVSSGLLIQSTVACVFREMCNVTVVSSGLC